MAIAKFCYIRVLHIFHNEDNEKNSIKTKYNNIKGHFIVKIKKYRISHKIHQISKYAQIYTFTLVHPLRIKKKKANQKTN